MTRILRALMFPLLLAYNLYAWLMMGLAMSVGIVLGAFAMRRHPEAPELHFFNAMRWCARLWGLSVGIRFTREAPPASLDPRQAYIYTPNHTTTLDMFFVAWLPTGFRVLAKKEIRRIPIMGWLTGMASISVDRSSPESRRASMYAMRACVERGVSVAVFPEGTRNRTPAPLKDFYDGAFRIAIEQQVPVVPVIINGGRACMPGGSLLMRPGHLHMSFLPPVPSVGLDTEGTKALKAEVYRRMEAEILRLGMR